MAVISREAELYRLGFTATDDGVIYRPDGKPSKASHRKDGHMYLKQNKEHRQVEWHRFLWYVFNGEIPEGYIIHHKDFDCTNNHLNNLECMSVSEHHSLHNRETKDYSYLTGVNSRFHRNPPKGELNGRYRNDIDRHAIVTMRKEGLSYNMIVKMTGVPKTTVARIIKGAL